MAIKHRATNRGWNQHVEGQPGFKSIPVNRFRRAGPQKAPRTGNPPGKVVRQKINSNFRNCWRRRPDINNPAHGGGDKIDAGHVIAAMALAIIQHDQATVGPAGQHRFVQFQLIHDGGDIIGPVLAVLVGRRVLGLAGAAMAAIVDGDQAEIVR